MTKTILVYGGTGGIGASAAKALKARGYKVHLAARDEAKLVALAQQISATWTAGDVLDPDFLTRATQEAAPDGILHGLIYAVGTINLKPIARLKTSDFETDFRINAVSAAQAIQAALPALKAGEDISSVILFSTVAVAQGFAAHASVAMAKGAVEGLTLAMAAELSPKIRVNCIAPSLTRTNLAKPLTGNESMATAIAGMHAMGRLGEPDDIGPLAAFLTSDEASWITGQIIGVDGGRSTLRTKG
jgi:NAD(P)-dependent dehydrogenase (short-subunit alcohol dehydrogenase family)